MRKVISGLTKAQTNVHCSALFSYPITCTRSYAAVQYVAFLIFLRKLIDTDRHI